MDHPAPKDAVQWHRHFAVEMNNRAWQHAENADRTAAEAEEMLDAAHAAAIHWSRAGGTELNRARAEMLLAHTHALAGSAAFALRYARLSYDYLSTHEAPDWEIAFAHAILANAARVAGENSLYAEHYAQALRLGNAIAGPEDRDIFNRTFAQIPAPTS